MSFGVLPGGGGTQRLSRLIGASRTVEFVLRSRIVDPQTALSMGLIHELADDALGRAGEIATEVAGLPPLAIGCAKRAIYGGSDTHLAAGLEMEGSAVLETLLSDDCRLAMKTFRSMLRMRAQKADLGHQGVRPSRTGRLPGRTACIAPRRSRSSGR